MKILRVFFILRMLYSNHTWYVDGHVAPSVKSAENGSSQKSSTGLLEKMFKNKNRDISSDPDIHFRHGHGVCDPILENTRRYRGGHSHSHRTSSGHVDDTSLTLTKLLLTICLTSLNVSCWLVPLKVKRFIESKLAVSLANAFSGGVFLSLAFGHMIPHAVHGFEDLELPPLISYYLTLAGYLFIFFVEKIAFDAHDILHDHDHGHHHNEGSSKEMKEQSSAKKSVTPIVSEGGSSGRSAVVLLLALSVHSLFETMALGLSNSKVNALLLATSISLHQPAESLALLVSFIKTGLPQKSIIRLLSLFSCVGPMGVLLGIVVAQYAGELMDAVLVSLAAGTFIYVGATEVIADEFENPQHKWKKFAALISGVVIIGNIISWASALEDRVS